MHLQELFRVDDVLVGFDPVDKWDAIDRMMRHLEERGRFPAELADELSDAVLGRERSMSTGMERGIAVPHAAVEGIEEVIACLGVVQREGGLSFESVDASPARFLVLLLIPRAQKLVHIRTLSTVARSLSDESVRSALLAAGSSEEAWQALGQSAHT